MSEQSCPPASRTMPGLEHPHRWPPLPHIRLGAMLAGGASIGAVRLASDLIQFVWWPAQAPFSFEVGALSDRLLSVLPGSAWTAWRVRRYRAWAMTFFRQVGADQWVPLPDYYELPARQVAQEFRTARHSW